MAITGIGFSPDTASFTLECDVCGFECEEEFDTFLEVVEWKKEVGKEEGWISRKTPNGWEDVCPECHGSAAH